MEPTYLTINAVGTPRTVTEGGREYLVVPMTSIVEGVLNGSKGALYYPADEIRRDVRQWDGTDIVVYHPTDRATGRPLAATDPVHGPRVRAEFGVGVLRNSRVKATNGPVRLQHDGWFDVERTKKLDAVLAAQGKPQILPRLMARQPIELSTGLFTDNVPADNGSYHNGTPYAYVARNYRKDHLAVLPDQQGACSLKSGCGVGVENAEADQELWDLSVTNSAATECVLNAESLCVNCGGKGGTKGPCPGQKRGSKAKAKAPPSKRVLPPLDPAVAAKVRKAAGRSASHQPPSPTGKTPPAAPKKGRNETKADEHDAAAKTHLGRIQKTRAALSEYGVDDAASAQKALKSSKWGATAKAKIKDMLAELDDADRQHSKAKDAGEYHRKRATRNASRDPFRHPLAAPDQVTDHSTEGLPVNKTALVQWLTTNCKHFADKATLLGTLDEPTLAGMKADAEAARAATTNAANLTNNCSGAKTFDELVRTDPAAAATWNTAKKIEARERSRLIGLLTANAADPAKKAVAAQRYGAMDTEALADLVEAMPPVTNASDARHEFNTPAPVYAGSVFPATPVANANRYDGSAAPLLPFADDGSVDADNPVANYRKRHAQSA